MVEELLKWENTVGEVSTEFMSRTRFLQQVCNLQTSNVLDSEIGCGGQRCEQQHSDRTRQEPPLSQVLYLKQLGVICNDQQCCLTAAASCRILDRKGRLGMSPQWVLT